MNARAVSFATERAPANNNMRTSGKAALLALLGGTVSLFAQSTINSSNRFGYGANIGWTDWKADGANGVVSGEYVCRGYIYAANVGWIHLGSGSPANGIGYQNNSALDYGVNHDGLGNLRGYAWGANIGWINFENTGAPRFNLFTGKLTGDIWSANCGWISLSNAIAFVQTDSMVPGLDSDNDGLADAFELIHTGGLSAMNGSTDSDGDGSSDLSEYLAGTNPMSASSLLTITAFNSGVSNSLYTLTWKSEQTRGYYLQTRSNLNVGTPWINHSLGQIMPDPGPATTRTATDSPTGERYIQIKAVRPLVP
jgi:hypothetical protein